MKGLGIFLVIMTVVYLFGPRVEFDRIEPNPFTYDYAPGAVEEILRGRDAEILDLKEGNGSQLYWANETKSKTEFVVLYLHGFSASTSEGIDVYPNYAKSIGANAIAVRLYDSGRNSKDTFKGLTPKLMMDSAKDAIALAKCLGDKVIVISCSTGGTYSTYLSGYDDQIVAQVLMSPNIGLYDETSKLVLKPWGRKLLNALQGGEYNNVDHYTDEQKKFWNDAYHNDGILALVDLLDQTMKEEHFQKITIPTLVIAFYTNEEEQDKVVSVKRMREFFDQISTPDEKKKFVNCTTCGNHVLGSKLFNVDIKFVEDQINNFSKEVLKIGFTEEVLLAN